MARRVEGSVVGLGRLKNTRITVVVLLNKNVGAFTVDTEKRHYKFAFK